LTPRKPQQAPPLSKNLKWAFLALLFVVTVIYAAHFNSEFHLDDIHTTVQNPWIRDLHNLPKFFTDTDTSGVLAANRVFRPILTTSLAFDYWLGGGLKPVAFHASNLFWFLVLLTMIFLLCRKIFQTIMPPVVSNAGSDWAALFAAALYGLHPAMAETVSYVIQRSEIYSTLGVAAGLAIYILAPGQRKYCLYLIPVAIGILTKPPALVFPFLLFAYLTLIEGADRKAAAIRSLPALALTVILGVLSNAMTPHGFTPGAGSVFAYRITQPAVLMRFFRVFFLPAGLTADTDRVAYTTLADPGATLGFGFIAAILVWAWWTARRRETRPIAFGVVWFLVASLPTAAFAVAEVENDHRMFFPFVGLTIAVVWTATLWLARHSVKPSIAVPVCGLALAGCAYGAWTRCDVWMTEESLWHDVTVNSPRNGRGWMNYGLTLMARGDYAGALDCYLHALQFTPNYTYLETNLGIAYGGLHNDAEAKKHFLRAIQLAPEEASAKYFYARWLNQTGQPTEAILFLEAGIRENPSYTDDYYLLMQILADRGDSSGVRQTANRLLALFPNDATAASWLTRGEDPNVTPETYLNQSLALYTAHDYEGCIAKARKALALRPAYAGAWNNIGAAYNALGKWDEAIEAEKEAIRLDPNSQLAKNNLAWSQAQKAAHK
jgi:tetratricopeptide (TPR) repeat protein